MPTLAIDPVQALATVVRGMQLPQPVEPVAGAMHQVQAAIDQQRYKQQLHPPGPHSGKQLQTEPGAEQAQQQTAELDQAEVDQQVDKVGQAVVMVFQPGPPKGLQALQQGNRQQRQGNDRQARRPGRDAAIELAQQQDGAAAKDQRVTAPADQQAECGRHSGHDRLLASDCGHCGAGEA